MRMGVLGAKGAAAITTTVYGACKLTRLAIGRPGGADPGWTYGSNEDSLVWG